MDINSPCVNQCKYINNVCIGCYRTIEEISNWSTYSNEEKKEVLGKLTIRRMDNGEDYYG